jgi:hypothetical protein
LADIILSKLDGGQVPSAAMIEKVHQGMIRLA